MAILVDNNTKITCQGMAGSRGLAPSEASTVFGR